MSDLIPTYVEHLRLSGYSDRTYIEAREVLQRLHYDLPFGLAYAATEQIQGWALRPEWTRWTRRTYLKIIKAFYRWATSEDAPWYLRLDGDPAASLKLPKAPRLIPNPVTDAELARALGSSEPWHTAVLLAAYAGLRASEIGRARREHVTEDLVRVPIGKGGEPGVIPTHPLLWHVLADRPAGPLVLDGFGRPVTGRWLSSNARAHFDSLDMPQVHLHRFRHWFGTTIQAQYGDLRVTQECMRHADIGSTAGYTLVTGQRRASAICSIPMPSVTVLTHTAMDKGTPASL